MNRGLQAAAAAAVNDTNFGPYVVTKDGSRFLVPVAGQDTGPVPELVVVMNWPEAQPC